MPKETDPNLKFGTDIGKVKRNMKSIMIGENKYSVMAGIFGLSLILLLTWPAILLAASAEIPVKGMVTMVDLGAKTCIPCKMMAPILEKLKKEYAGRVAVIFLDVKKDPSLIKRYGISAIPTQIFFDKDGKGVLRHRGFMSEDAIVEQFKKMGIN